MSEPDWLDDIIARRAYNDPRIKGTFLAAQLAGAAFRHTLLTAFLDSWLGRQMYRGLDWLARRLQPAGEE